MSSDEQNAKFHPSLPCPTKAEMLDQIGAAVIAVDLDWNITYANRAFGNLYGWRPEEIIGRPVVELIVPAEARSGKRSLPQRKGFSLTGEFASPRRDGTLFTVSITDSPLCNRSGKVIGRLAIATDVTENKRAAEEVRCQQASLSSRIKTLSSAVEQAPDTVVITDHCGRVEYVNQAFERVSGFSAPEVIGRKTDFLKSGHHSPEFYEELWGTITSGKAFKAEFVNRNKKGELFYEEKTITPLRSDDGTVTHFVAVGRNTSERRAAVAALRASEERYRLMFDANPLPMWVMDRETLRFLAVNNSAVERYGYSREEFLSMSAKDIRPPTEGDKFAAAVRSQQDLLSAGVWRHRLKDGRIINVEISTHQLVFEGRPAYVVLAHDMTERMEAAWRLRISEERFRLLAKASNDAIWDWNVVEDTLWWNEGIKALFGYHPEDVPNWEAWASKLHPDDRETIAKDLQEALSSGATTWKGEYRFQRKDGSYAWVYDRAHVIRDSLGNPLRAIGGMTDITERRLAEERIAEQAALLAEAREAILVKSLDDTIIYWNKGAERIYGFSATEAIGRKAGEFLHSGSTEYADAFAALLKKGEWTGELQVRNRDSRLLTVEVRWTLVRRADGTPKSILAIDLDMTERKKLEAQFLRAQRMESIGTLAGGIAHDLNNVLTPILMSVELLQDQVSSDDARAVLGTIASSAQRGADMVKQVLSFARGTEGARVAVSVTHLAGDIQKIARDTFPKNIEFRLRAARDLWTVSGDPTHLHQVLMNLCVNARDAMPLGGRLVVEVENTMLDEVYASVHPDSKPGKYVAITVADTGTGIPQEIRDKIFDPFFTTKEPGRGTGLGLATVMSLVKEHQGFLNLYSEVGKGTTFKVYLPANEDDPSVKKSAAGADALPRGNRELVLVVDDEEPVRQIAKRTLESFGFRVLLAANGAEAISRYAQQPDQIAVVLTDMAMPVMDGTSTVIALRTLNPNVKVIGSSGLSAHQDITKALGVGLQHFVSKPYTADTLIRTLHQALAAGS